jgi:uncharacterized protein
MKAIILITLSALLLFSLDNRENGIVQSSIAVNNNSGNKFSDMNSNSVPSCFTMSSDFKRIVVVRLKNGTDVLEGLKEAVKKEQITNGVIINGIGSLTRYRLHVVNNNTFPTENVFMEADNPVDLLAVSGYVINHRVHSHLTLSDEKKAIGGHLEKGCSVFTFVIITIGVLEDDASLENVDNINW